MRWLLHYNTDSLRKHKPSLPCSLLLSNNYVIIKACSGNIMGSVQRKSQLTSSRQTFLSRPSFVSWQIKVDKIDLLCDRTLFYPSSINFVTQSLIISLQHIELCISLLSQSLWILCIIMKEPLLIVRVILWRWSAKTLILSSLRR